MEATIKRWIVAGLLAGAFAAPAWGHAFLERASPAAGENLLRGPAAVEMHFSEALEPAFSGITVTDESGRDMRGGAATVDGGTLRQPVLPLKPGRYRVTWHAVSVDTHRTDGKYNFLVTAP